MANNPPLARVRLALDSRPHCLTLIRAMLGGFAEAVEMERDRFDDVRTAVSEACNNVVLHAYDGGVGPLTVELELRDAALRISVLDRGNGIRSIISATERMRVGLALISALADRAEVLNRPGGGTEVRIAFAGPGPLGEAPPALSADADDRMALEDEVLVELAPAGLLAPVLGRVAAVVAAQAHFSLDRHGDLQLVTDELAALARSKPLAGGTGFALATSGRALELRLGPLAAGSWERLRLASGPQGDGWALPRLIDGFAVTAGQDVEMLSLRVAGRRPVPPPSRCGPEGLMATR